MKPPSISRQQRIKDAPDVPTQATGTPSSPATQQVSTNPANSEKTEEGLQNAATSSPTSTQQVFANPSDTGIQRERLQNAKTTVPKSTQQVSANPADNEKKRVELQAAGNLPSNCTQNPLASPTDTRSTRERLQAERAVAVEGARTMAHSHEESPTRLVTDFNSQTGNRPEEKLPTRQVSFSNQDRDDRGSATTSDSLPDSTAHSQQASPGILSQDFSQTGTQLKESSLTIPGSLLGQAIHDREGASTSDPLPGSMLAHSPEESPRDLMLKSDQEENQLEEFPAIEDSILGQATHDQGGATTPDSLPGQSELPRPPSPETGLLTSSFSQLNVSYLVPQVRNPTYSLFPPFRIDNVIAARQPR